MTDFFYSCTIYSINTLGISVCLSPFIALLSFFLFLLIWTLCFRALNLVVRFIGLKKINGQLDILVQLVADSPGISDVRKGLLVAQCQCLIDLTSQAQSKFVRQAFFDIINVAQGHENTNFDSERTAKQDRFMKLSDNGILKILYMVSNSPQNIKSEILITQNDIDMIVSQVLYVETKDSIIANAYKDFILSVLRVLPYRRSAFQFVPAWFLSAESKTFMCFLERSLPEKLEKKKDPLFIMTIIKHINIYMFSVPTILALLFINYNGNLIKSRPPYISWFIVLVNSVYYWALIKPLKLVAMVIMTPCAIVTLTVPINEFKKVLNPPKQRWSSIVRSLIAKAVGFNGSSEDTGQQSSYGMSFAMHVRELREALPEVFNGNARNSST